MPKQLFCSGPDNYQIAAVSLVANLNVINTTTQTINIGLMGGI